MNKVYIAAAGTGKTSHIVKELNEIHRGDRVLITTYTVRNTENIKNRIRSTFGYLPANFDIMPWFTFLLRHCVRPFQFDVFPCRINGIIDPYSLEPKRSFKLKRGTELYYCPSKGKIYSDRLSDFAIFNNKRLGGSVIYRLQKIYKSIYIDEAQDLAGYDFNLLLELFKSDINITLVLDPRQTTFQTTHSNKNKKYRNGNIASFLKNNRDAFNIIIDEETLNKNFRCNSDICKLSNMLFPDLKQILPTCTFDNPHQGVFFVPKKLTSEYISKFSPTILTYNKRTKVESASGCQIINFGACKGEEFDRVLIFPPTPIKKLLTKSSKELNLHICDSQNTINKFYVALTRARLSVAIVMDKIPDRIYAPFIQVYGKCDNNGSNDFLLDFFELLS